MMRIAYVNTYFQSNHTGGGHVHMGQFVSNAVALGHEVWTYPNQNYSAVYTIPTTRLEHIKTMRQMDVLYVRVEKKSPEICKWAMPPRRLLYGFPVVVWEFNTIPDEALKLDEINKNGYKVECLLKNNGRGCDLAVCVTPALAEIVQKTLGIQRVLVVPNGSDPELFYPEAPVVKRLIPFQGKLNVVWIGSGREVWHDLQMLGEAAQIVGGMESGRDIAFHIIGPDVNGLMAEMGSNVYYWGAEYYDKLPGWLAGMDVGLSLYHPSPADYGSPLKVFDYFSSGLTVVSTPHPVVRNLFSKIGQLDNIVSSGDSKSLANLLIQLASDKERVKRLGRVGRQLVIDHYNWRRAVQDTMNEIESILSERGRTKRP